MLRGTMTRYGLSTPERAAARLNAATCRCFLPLPGARAAAQAHHAVLLALWRRRRGRGRVHHLCGRGGRGRGQGGAAGAETHTCVHVCMVYKHKGKKRAGLCMLCFKEGKGGSGLKGEM